MFYDNYLKIAGASIIAASLIVVFFIDIDTMTISDWNSVFIVIGGLFIVYSEDLWLINSITGLVALIFMVLIYFISHKGIGSGDVILIAASAFAIGPFNTIFSIFLASLFGIIYAIASKSSMKTKVPFGPFLAIGIYVSMLFGGYFSSLLEKLYL
jgi:leader peptidase (prepilin peptidase)/N-methyltransferase